ncbi:hypothetical protein [Tardiphaga sp.]|uniref:hypothetical protein n=1 Tax=Tardiphaga sp. TaxID=1926292 RepID=UPI00261EBA8B|nr:hypothetical protein [Tardiphaga sp.]MDB5617037.1 hypothetical protein [Tardiphaga sp.]
MNHAHPANRVHYRERSTDRVYKKGHILSVRVDEDMFQKLTQLRKLLATRIGVRETTMSTALAYCIATANAA